MTFEEFKNTFPWVFRPNNIEYHVNTNEEVYTNIAGEETAIHHVEVTINSKAPNGELAAAVSLTPRDAIVFIAHLTQYLDSNRTKRIIK